MEVKINNVKFVSKWLQSKIRQTKELVDREIEKIPVHAQRNYNKFVIEVPADDPYVNVYSSFTKTPDKTTLQIDCRGRQVLFIEFGAGIYYYTETELSLYKPYMAGVSDRGNPRVDDIGHYSLAIGGRSRGMDDYWFYKSETGRESKNAHLVKYTKKDGAPIMITHGNRPSRSLYRATGMAKRRIFSRYARKPRRIGGYTND